MLSDEEAALVCFSSALIAFVSLNKEKRGKRRKPKSQWVKTWLKRRDSLGAYNCILNKLRLQDRENFRKYLRMNESTFKEILELIRPNISKEETLMRLPISAEEKLAVTLRFLATGESYESLMYSFRIHRTTTSKFVPVVCQEIYLALKEKCLNIPSTSEEWDYLIEGTAQRWQFPNCFGAADGKHIALTLPTGSGSEFYNYKGFYSIVMLAVVDFDYKFLFIDVGCQGRISDGGVFRHSPFYKALENGSLNLPNDRPLPQNPDPCWQFGQSTDDMPIVFVADDAFPLGKHCMKPYPHNKLFEKKRILNYRLSRMRRITENAFGIWANRFRIFGSKINLHPDKAIIITLASIVLHNLLRTKSSETYTPAGYLDEEIENGELRYGGWRRENNIDFVRSLPATKSNRTTKSAEKIRDIFADHFFGPGEIPWQWNMI